MPKGKGIVGHTLYFELHRGDSTQQIFFTQSLYDQRTDSIVPVSMLARVLSPKNPRRKWRAKRLNLTGLSANVATRSLAEIPSVQDAKQAATPLLEAITNELNLVIDTGWELVGPPAVVEMTETDLEACRLSKAPEALIRRINSARVDAGYPENLIQTASNSSAEKEELALAY